MIYRRNRIDYLSPNDKNPYGLSPIGKILKDIADRKEDNANEPVE